MLFGVACNSNTAEKKADAAHGYYYYPKPNVYFDTTDKTFFFFDTTKKNWISGNLPSHLQRDLGKSALVANAPDPVWTDNKNHRLVYSATLYSDSTDFKEDSSKKEKATKKSTSKKTTEKKKKNKVSEFFKKIFGKK